MESLRDEESKISALEQSLKDIEKFEEDLKEAIKDEHAAPPMYEPIARSAENLNRTLQQFSFSQMARGIRNIIRDETGHERAFTDMLNIIQQYERSLKDEIKRHKDNVQRLKRDEEQRKEEERKRSEKLKEGYHGPYKLKRY